MGTYLKVVLFVLCLVGVPAALFAQSDMCSTLPTVSSYQTSNNTSNSEIVVEQMKERAAAQALQEVNRKNWSSKMIMLKNNIPVSTLRSLCIFHVEVVLEPAMRMLSVRAPQELMASIEDAVKRLDVPQPGPKSVELTISVVVASDQDESLRPIPASVKPVVDQLKTVLSYKQFYLLDTLLSTTQDGHGISLDGGLRGLEPPDVVGKPRDTGYNFQTQIVVLSDASTPTVRLSNLRFRLNMSYGVTISTDVDVPQGKQVVVGKSTFGDRAYILVVSAKISN
jgi:hypothetical protein